MASYLWRAKVWTLILTVLVMGLMFSPVPTVMAQPCTVHSKSFAYCKSLNALGSSLAWNLFSQNSTLEIAFTEEATTQGWVGWGINPTGESMMVGSQVLVAFWENTTSLLVKTYDLTTTLLVGSPVLLPGKVSLNYMNYSAEATGTTVTIFATLQLQPNQSDSLIHVWNRGPSVNLTTYQPSPHIRSGQNLQSVANLDMSSGATGALTGIHLRLKENHGIIGAVSWGILLPIGVMAARYLRPFQFADPLWFYLHVIFQLTGYTGGVVAWAMGLKLLHYASRPLLYPKHRNLGITIFVLATLQVLAVVLRPKKDQKIRPYWNVYHHIIGYATIIVIIINIFEGLHVLQPNHKWRRAYIIVLIILGAISIVLELVTWIVWFHRRKLMECQLQMHEVTQKL
ncbi:unnamed protein product, partial [Sphagnum troendelagicum]